MCNLFARFTVATALKGLPELMTAFQRFVIAALLFFMVCLVGVALLVLTGKVALL